MNLLNQRLKGIQTSRAEVQKTIQELEEYLEILNLEEQKILEEMRVYD